MCKYGKLDIQNAYKIVPIHYSQDFYVDKTLPMGLSYSFHLFEEFSTAVHWVCEKMLGICGKLVHLLDDF